MCSISAEGDAAGRIEAVDGFQEAGARPLMHVLKFEVALGAAIELPAGDRAGKTGVAFEEMLSRRVIPIDAQRRP